MSPAVAAAAAVLVAGCGGGGGPATTSTRASSPDGGEGTSAVSVLGSRVTIDAERVMLDLRLRQPTRVDPPIARTATVTLPAGVSFRGGAQATCSVATVKSGGAGACPKASVIGSGHALGKADTAQTDGEITILDGGPRTVLFATVVRHPVYVTTVVAAKLADTGGGGPRVVFRFPRDLQEIGGVPVGLERLQLTLRRGRAIAIGDCPPADQPWRYTASVAFADHTEARHAGTAACS